MNIKIRRFGSNAVHYAEIGSDMLVPAKVWGADCELIPDPITASCRAVLRGRLVRMNDYQRVTCRTCSLLSAPLPEDSQ